MSGIKLLYIGSRPASAYLFEPNFSVYTAESSNHAIACVTNRNPEVVLLDDLDVDARESIVKSLGEWVATSNPFIVCCGRSPKLYSLLLDYYNALRVATVLLEDLTGCRLQILGKLYNCVY